MTMNEAAGQAVVDNKLVVQDLHSIGGEETAADLACEICGEETTASLLTGLCGRCRGYLMSPLMKELVRARVDEDRRGHPGPVVRLAWLNQRQRHDIIYSLVHRAGNVSWDMRRLSGRVDLSPPRYRAALLHLAMMALAAVEAGDARETKGDTP